MEGFEQKRPNFIAHVEFHPFMFDLTYTHFITSADSSQNRPISQIQQCIKQMSPRTEINFDT